MCYYVGEKKEMKKNKRKNSINPDDLKVLTDRQTPASEWVYSLLEHMFKSHLKSFTLKKSEGIPSIPLRDELPEGELNFSKIINRVKIMSGLDPVIFKEPHGGKHTIIFHGKQYTMKTTFIDSEDDQICEIHLYEEKG